MKMFVSALLVGLAGTVVHAHPGFHELSDSVELSERAADITKCKAKAPNTTKACKLNDVSSVGFYGYNPRKKKCMKYPHCSIITGDAFSSREKCYQTCDACSCSDAPARRGGQSTCHHITADIAVGMYADIGNLNASKEVEARNLPQECLQPIYNVLSGCTTEYIFRYSYNSVYGYCEEVISCEGRVEHGFPSRKECLEKCNPYSPCLKEWEYFRGYYRKIAFYDEEEDECVETTAPFSSAELYPKGNLFETAQDCRLSCAPTHHD